MARSRRSCSCALAPLCRALVPLCCALVAPWPLSAQDACVAEGAEPSDALLTPAPHTPEAVTLDAPVLVRFPAGTNVLSADPQALLQLWQVAEDAGGPTQVSVPGRYERFAAQPNVLVFRPEGGLLPDTDYVGDVVDPSGLEPRQLSFTTGEGTDDFEPRMQPGPPSVRSRTTSSQCGAVRVDVVFVPAAETGEGPVSSVEHLVFQTRGAGLGAPVLRQRVRASMTSAVSASFLLSEIEAANPICVAVLPVDGTGRVGEATQPACFTPAASISFVGLCSASSVPSRMGEAWGAGLLLVSGVWMRRRLRA